jgi:hypothetical protein
MVSIGMQPSCSSGLTPQHTVFKSFFTHTCDRHPSHAVSPKGLREAPPLHLRHGGETGGDEKSIAVN